MPKVCAPVRQRIHPVPVAATLEKDTAIVQGMKTAEFSVAEATLRLAVLRRVQWQAEDLIDIRLHRIPLANRYRRRGASADNCASEDQQRRAYRYLRIVRLSPHIADAALNIADSRIKPIILFTLNPARPCRHRGIPQSRYRPDNRVPLRLALIYGSNTTAYTCDLKATRQNQ